MPTGKPIYVARSILGQKCCLTCHDGDKLLGGPVIQPNSIWRWMEQGVTSGDIRKAQGFLDETYGPIYRAMTQARYEKVT